MTDQTDIPEDDRDGRAAEYVLGTLSLEERLAFEAALARDAALRQAVAQWSARLQPLADSVAPVPPPPALRHRVLARIAPPAISGQAPFSVWRWLAWTIGASALAGAVAVAAVFIFTPRGPEVGGYAQLHRTDAAATDVVAFQIDKQHREMIVVANAAAPGAGRDYELWVLPPGGKAPVSLGVVKAGQRDERPIPTAAVAYLTDKAGLAISVEPAGGAPGGAPTGPIVFLGNITLVAGK